MKTSFREFLSESDTSELDIKVGDVITLTGNYSYCDRADMSDTLKLPKGSKYKITKIKPNGNDFSVYMRIEDEKVFQLYNKRWRQYQVSFHRNYDDISKVPDVSRDDELLFFTSTSRYVDNKLSRLKYTVNGVSEKDRVKSLKINFNIKYKGELSKEDIIKLLTDNYKNITDIS